MGHMCYLCQRKASKRNRISLHKFPKNPIARNKWIKACDLSLSDNLTYIFICSMHFTAKDIERGNDFQLRSTLRAGAVPSIGVPNQICSNNENIDTLNDGTENNANINEVETTNTYENVNGLDNVVDNANTFDNVFEDVHVQELQSLTHASDESNKSPIEQRDDIIKLPPLVTADVTLECEVNEDVRKLEESCFTTPKRRFFEPRYISEIRTPDLETPKRTRRILNFIRATDKKKSKLIKSLQDRNRNLEKRISSLKQIIADLKKKSMVSNDTEDSLLVQYLF